ncbi:MAG: DUF998 domain-containing protein [Promethearchaeota archaeon]
MIYSVWNLKNKLFKPKYIGFYGMILPFISMGLVFISIIVNSSNFTLTENLISDLGYYSAMGPTAIIYNLSLVISGIHLIIFSFGYTWLLNQEFEGRSRTITTLGGRFLTGMGVFLIANGMFTRDVEIIHAPISLIVAFFLIFSMGIISMGMFLEKRLRLFATLGILGYVFFGGLFLFSFFVYFAYGIAMNVAMVQLSAVSVFYLWLFQQSYRIFKTDLVSLVN